MSSPDHAGPIPVVFLVNGGPSGAMGERARAFASRLDPKFDPTVVYRHPNKFRAIGVFLWHLWRRRARIVYVLDMAFSGVIAAAIDRLLRRSVVVIDTGDAIHELSKSIGRGRLGRLLTGWLERFSFLVAHHTVVRGSYHRDLLASRGVAVTFLPDGVDLDQFQPQETTSPRHELGLDGKFVVGLIGSLMWNEPLQICYGWDLVEAIAQLEDRRVCGVLIGDGTGVERLRASCRAHGIEDRIFFLGRQPYERLPALLGVMDVCLSTQTNDLPGRVRTTGKLPLYLAAGRHVLASRVGEASGVLPEAMLVDYDGVVDREYPRRLGQRIAELAGGPDGLARPEESRAIAAAHFDYDLLAGRLNRLLADLTRRKR